MFKAKELMSYIVIQELYKSYTNPHGKKDNSRVDVLVDFNLSVEHQEFITFFGPNGCGKTTLLNMIAGLANMNKGKITVNNKSVKETKIGYVFQNFQMSFLPWKSNIDNIAFPLELQGSRKRERRKIARDFLQQLDIKIPETAYPYQLSGGQQQLVAIARALISNPEILLLDEPFNQLDYQTRISMHDKLLDIWEKTKTTILFVSHELDEAIILGDKIVFLSKRPARILEILENDLPRPRKHDIVRSEKFFVLKKHGLSVFEQALKE